MVLRDKLQSFMLFNVIQRYSTVILVNQRQSEEPNIVRQKFKKI